MKTNNALRYALLVPVFLFLVLNAYSQVQLGENIALVRLLDQRGRIIWTGKGNVNQIDLSPFPAGVYQLLVQLTNNRWGRQQIVKN